MMTGRGKSDNPIVRYEVANKAENRACGGRWREGVAKGTPRAQRTPGLQGRKVRSARLSEYVRQQRRDKKKRYRALHHI